MNDTSFDITKESNPVQTVAPTNKEDNEMLRATEKITALYCRLSVEDIKDEKKNGKEDPSNSIQHQQVMLMQYAKANRLPNPTYFIDDGYSGVTVTNINLEPSLLYDDDKFEKTVKLIETYFVSGGAQLQINAVSRAELEDAKKNSEKHGSLRVRVSGFSDYFTNLTEPIQDNIIERTSLK